MSWATLMAVLQDIGLARDIGQVKCPWTSPAKEQHKQQGKLSMESLNWSESRDCILCVVIAQQKQSCKK